VLLELLARTHARTLARSHARTGSCTHARTHARTRRLTISKDNPRVIQVDCDDAFQVHAAGGRDGEPSLRLSRIVEFHRFPEAHARAGRYKVSSPKFGWQKAAKFEFKLVGLWLFLSFLICGTHSLSPSSTVLCNTQTHTHTQWSPWASGVDWHAFFLICPS
jgi:hypothetical protein